MGLSSTEFLLNLLLLTVLFAISTSAPFKCTSSSSSTCHALIDYIPPNTTSLSSLKTLFSVKNLRSILGANNLPLSTPSNNNVPAQTTIKIPFPCICSNGTGISNSKPIYIVQPGDILDHIAREVFSGLVTFQEIAAVNSIPDANVIEAGQKLRIPLPCSCDEVGGERVVHYGHIVESGSTLEVIAEEYGTSKDILMSLNNGVNDTSLLAGQILDVPLQACNSSVTTSSLDYPLLVPNGTYAFTANSCVRCKCDSANNWILQCEPSGLTIANSTWSTCPPMKCDGADNLSIGNSTNAGCNTTTCAYAGFSNQTILTALATVSTCPASTPGSGSDNYASSSGMSWKFLIISLHLFLLCVYPLQ
ncbi:lysM domain-containing GPI-anchored protein 2 [Ricinus communis]|uniref:LysM domain GPI-anchored protein 2, putative n=1 Tax=Ricinus communis TaxID=3988 RepID=B9SIJ2_RICCO|nr:lysM domain-containing GPI-anchored protein 2 [Ricinus communis]EEF36585.1 LysM domain GPI-anchored protein 2 precursor, putative [Ricinus communis]|eukprot:XP_002525811.1 lysM domain-containing GPI-anchored protein 2 [Ricinus communis]